MLDLNGFKDVNDEHGHVVGDELLKAVATELARSAGPGDFVARLGGDEFAWISPSHAAADRLCETFADRIAQPIPIGELSLRIGAAMGVAAARPGLTASALIAEADARLYEKKLASQPRSRLHDGPSGR
jgi:diguanylate cyclase (GGDEF)-like protein